MRHGSGAAAAHAVRCSRLIAVIEERVERRDGHAFVLRRPIRTRLARTLVRGHPIGTRLARTLVRGHPIGIRLARTLVRGRPIRIRLVRAIIRGHPVGIRLVRAFVRPHHLVRAFARTKHGPGGACARCMSILERRVGGACEACAGKRHQGEHRALAAFVFRPVGTHQAAGVKQTTGHRSGGAPTDFPEPLFTLPPKRSALPRHPERVRDGVFSVPSCRPDQVITPLRL